MQRPLLVICERLNRRVCVNRYLVDSSIMANLNLREPVEPKIFPLLYWVQNLSKKKLRGGWRLHTIQHRNWHQQHKKRFLL